MRTKQSKAERTRTHAIAFHNVGKCPLSVHRSLCPVDVNGDASGAALTEKPRALEGFPTKQVKLEHLVLEVRLPVGCLEDYVRSETGEVLELRQPGPGGLQLFVEKRKGGGRLSMQKSINTS